MTESLLAATLSAPAHQVAEILTVCSPNDIGLLDPPTATALEVVADLVAHGQDADATRLVAELLRRGLYSGRQGELVRDRVLAATTKHVAATTYPELLPEYAAAVMAQVFRARLAAAGAAFTENAPNGVEDDLWQLIIREGKELRGIWDRLAKLRNPAKPNEVAA